jgi:hypothetical protein
MNPDSLDIRDRIVSHSIEFRKRAKESGEKIMELQGDKKKLEKFMEEDMKANQGLINRFFALVDEYEAIQGEVQDGN